MTKRKKKEQGIRAYPLAWPDGWPRTPNDIQMAGAEFKQVDYDTGVRIPVQLRHAYDQLRDQLSLLRAENVVISTNYLIDQDGYPTVKPLGVKDEGVAIYFVLSGKPMAMACDRYQRAAANVRSLGLAVEAMRQLGRHGGGAMVERAFAGFVALPPPPSCWEILGVEAGASRDQIERAFRDRAKKMHPDAGGDDSAMAELNIARDTALSQIAA
jgi:hypothetical protein